MFPLAQTYPTLAVQPLAQGINPLNRRVVNIKLQFLCTQFFSILITMSFDNIKIMFYEVCPLIRITCESYAEHHTIYRNTTLIHNLSGPKRLQIMKTPPANNVVPFLKVT